MSTENTPQPARPSNLHMVAAMMGLAALLLIPLLTRHYTDEYRHQTAAELDPARAQISDALEIAHEARGYAQMAYFKLGATPHTGFPSPAARYETLLRRWEDLTRDDTRIAQVEPAALEDWRAGKRDIAAWLYSAGRTVVTGDLPDQDEFIRQTLQFQRGAHEMSLAREATSDLDRAIRDRGRMVSRIGLWTTAGTGLLVALLAGLMWRNAWQVQRLWQKEKETSERLELAVRETNHRVKNNLQVIAALVDMQVMDVESDVPREVLVDLSRQVKAVAAVHDFLSHELRADRVPAGQMLRRLVNLSADPAGLIVEMQADDTILPVKQATAVALMTNEMLLNSAKHGASHATVRLQSRERTTRLVVQDDGPGFPKGFSPERSANIGIALIQTLATRDLKGSVDFTNSEGACVEILFPTGAEEA